MRVTPPLSILMEHQIINVAALIAGAGVVSQWLAWRFRIPSIVILTVAGIVVGPLSGLVNPGEDFGALLKPIIQVAVAVILFEGGLNLHVHELREAGTGVGRLVSLGLVFSFILGSLAAHFIGGLSWPVAAEFGAITVVTGPTVIMPLLRHARLRQKTASVLKWEGIVNDPLGALLAVIVFEYFAFSGAGITGTGLAIQVASTLIGASAVGAGTGFILGWAYQRGYFPEYLKGPGMLAMALFVYAVGNMIHEEAGLLASTAMGLVLGNMNLPSIDEMRRFKEYITVLLVSTLFIVLTADLDPAVLRDVDWRSAALIAAIIFLVRPLAVFAATIGAGMDREDRVITAWIAPRGIVAAAVAGAFSSRLLEAGYVDADKLLPLVFALIFCTVVLHGFSIGILGRRLGVASGSTNGLIIVGASPWTVDLAQKLRELKIAVLLVDGSWHRLRPARLAGIPIYFGQLASEIADQTLDIGSMGYLLAATDNDAYNALLCTRFANEFGRHAVFQLPMLPIDQNDKKGLAPTLRGKKAFTDDALYEELLRRHFQGWRFQKTRLTDEYTFKEYMNDCDGEQMAAIVLRQNGVLNFESDNRTPASGDVVINFLPPKREK